MYAPDRMMGAPTDRGMIMTKITIVGNLTNDPDLRFTGGASVADFGVAVNDKIKDSSGNWVDGEPTFYRVAAWDVHPDKAALAQNVAASLSKGQRVIVTGTLRTEAYEKDGDKRTYLSIRADSVGVDLLFKPVGEGSLVGAVPQGGNDPWANTAPF